jgi:ubiquinone/menaquinone biosynthesis C-methylase UbiE
MKKKTTFSSIKNFTSPEIIPQNENDHIDWQNANKKFWENNPMRYDWNSKIDYTEGSENFFKEIDRRFFDSFESIFNWKKIPFDNFVNIEALKNKKVLEIGVGNGSHAQILAKNSLDYEGIDITDFAVEMTKKRLKNFNLQGTISKMDAENLGFKENTFDYIWSWGVIHHSSNTKKIISEINRVLKPKGKAFIMVYNRGWWNYYFVGIFFYGILKFGFFKGKSLNQIIQENTDGALARYYSKETWKKLTKKYFKTNFINISGNKSDIFPIPNSAFKRFILKKTPPKIFNLFLSYFKMGSFLISQIEKK